VLRCPGICSRSTGSETCGLTLKTEGESADNGTEVPHPSVQTTDGRMDHPPLQYRAGDSCLRHPPAATESREVEVAQRAVASPAVVNRRNTRTLCWISAKNAACLLQAGTRSGQTLSHPPGDATPPVNSL